MTQSYRSRFKGQTRITALYDHAVVLQLRARGYTQRMHGLTFELSL